MQHLTAPAGRRLDPQPVSNSTTARCSTTIAPASITARSLRHLQLGHGTRISIERQRLRPTPWKTSCCCPRLHSASVRCHRGAWLAPITLDARRSPPRTESTLQGHCSKSAAWKACRRRKEKLLQPSGPSDPINSQAPNTPLKSARCCQPYKHPTVRAAFDGAPGARLRSFDCPTRLIVLRTFLPIPSFPMAVISSRETRRRRRCARPTPGRSLACRGSAAQRAAAGYACAYRPHRARR